MGVGLCVVVVLFVVVVVVVVFVLVLVVELFFVDVVELLVVVEVLFTVDIVVGTVLATVELLDALLSLRYNSILPPAPQKAPPSPGQTKLQSPKFAKTEPEPRTSPQ